MKHLLYIIPLIIFHPFVMADSNPEKKTAQQLNKQDKDGRTELHYVVIVGDLSHYVLKKFILADNQGIVDVFNVDTKKYLDKVRLYLERGANPDIQDRWGNTPLFYVARTEKLSLFHLLLGKSSNPDIQNYLRNTLLHIASTHGHLGIVRFLIDKKSVKQYTLDSAYNSLFADLNPKEIELFQNILRGIDPLAIRLDNKEASLYIRNNFGKIPIHIAAEGGHTKIVRLFIEKGVHPDIRSGAGFAPIHMAILHRHLGLVRYLIDDGKANPNIQTPYGYTPLDLAELLEEKEIIKFLLENKCQTAFRRLGHDPPNS